MDLRNLDAELNAFNVQVTKVHTSRGNAPGFQRGITRVRFPSPTPSLEANAWNRKEGVDDDPLSCVELHKQMEFRMIPSEHNIAILSPYEKNQRPF